MYAKMKARTKETFRPFMDWLEDRAKVVSFAKQLASEPVPTRGIWLYSLGSATLFLITLQFMTGILLLFYYSPTIDHAWDSIYYIMNEAYFGQFIRGIHFWSANLLLAVIGLHMMRTFLSGSYKAPRELNWLVGVFLIFIVSVLAFTGYALRWDQEGFWAWEVGIKIGSYTPVFGDWVAPFLLGGNTVGPATLTRVFGIHVWLMPALLAPLIGLHLLLLRLHGEFGMPLEYSERLAKLRKTRQLEELSEEEPASQEELEEEPEE